MMTVRVGSVTWTMKELTTERIDAERKFNLIFKEERLVYCYSVQGTEERMAYTFKEQLVAVAR